MIALFVAGFVAIVVLVELFAAVLPLLVILVWVPPDERPALAAVLSAASGSRRLTCWSALRVIAARRQRTKAAAGGSPH